MPKSIRWRPLTRIPLWMAFAAAVSSCASHPGGKAPTGAIAPAVIAHGVVSDAAVRSERMKTLVQAGVVPLERRAVNSYLAALDARLRGAVAGNTADIAEVNGTLVVVLPARVLFEPDIDKLTPLGEKFLAALAEVLRGESQLLVEAACHTDRMGTIADNEAFSQSRAALVRDALAAHGLDALHVIAVGSGDHFPVADNATADGRRRNRRVELSLLPVVR
jgi:outer membrane protein OmpA-like peptidoglycan-associated protein